MLIYSNKFKYYEIKEFKNRIRKLPPNERVVVIKQKAKEVAKEKGLVFDKKISKKNNRHIYKNEKAMEYYSVDTQHGTFEHCNKKGKHIEEVDFNFE